MEQLSFEDAFEQLQATVRELEAGDLTLERSLILFERGVALATLCDSLLDNAELHVRQVVASGSGGFEAQPFDRWELERGA
jgi:exodeoxyribonuclease VII small subunit